MTPRHALEMIAGKGRDLPLLVCQERSSGSLCGRPAEWWAEVTGLGGAVVCERCARFYATAWLLDPLKSHRDALALIGNLRQQADAALEAMDAEVAP